MSTFIRIAVTVLVALGFCPLSLFGSEPSRPASNRTSDPSPLPSYLLGWQERQGVTSTVTISNQHSLSPSSAIIRLWSAAGTLVANQQVIVPARRTVFLDLTDILPAGYVGSGTAELKTLASDPSVQAILNVVNAVDGTSISVHALVSRQQDRVLGLRTVIPAPSPTQAVTILIHNTTDVANEATIYLGPSKDLFQSVIVKPHSTFSAELDLKDRTSVPLEVQVLSAAAQSLTAALHCHQPGSSNEQLWIPMVPFGDPVEANGKTWVLLPRSTATIGSDKGVADTLIIKNWSNTDSAKTELLVIAGSKSVQYLPAFTLRPGELRSVDLTSAGVSRSTEHSEIHAIVVHSAIQTDNLSIERLNQDDDQSTPILSTGVPVASSVSELIAWGATQSDADLNQLIAPTSIGSFTLLYYYRDQFGLETYTKTFNSNHSSKATRLSFEALRRVTATNGSLQVLPSGDVEGVALVSTSTSDPTSFSPAGTSRGCEDCVMSGSTEMKAITHVSPAYSETPPYCQAPTPNPNQSLTLSNNLFFVGTGSGGARLSVPSGYALGSTSSTLTLNNASGGSFQWAITRGTSQASFGAGYPVDNITTNVNSVTVYAGNISSVKNDVLLQVTWTPSNASQPPIVVELATTVDGPYVLSSTGPSYTNSHQDMDCDVPNNPGDVPYQTFIYYQVLSFLGKPVPQLSINEEFAAPESDITPSSAQNWTASPPRAGSHALGGNGAFMDNVCVPSNTNRRPPTQPMYGSGSSQAIFHLFQTWYVGSATPGAGTGVQSDTLQYYVDHGAHLNINR